jgi:hypothetical protein
MTDYTNSTVANSNSKVKITRTSVHKQKKGLSIRDCKLEPLKANATKPLPLNNLDGQGQSYINNDKITKESPKQYKNGEEQLDLPLLRESNILKNLIRESQDSLINSELQINKLPLQENRKSKE